MILVPKIIHEKAVHKGAWSIYNDILKARVSKSQKALRKAHELRRGLGFIGDIARRGTGPLAVFCTYSIAKEGWAADGVRGASRALMRDSVYADEVEIMVRTNADAIDDYFFISDGDGYRERQKYKDVWDAVYPGGKPRK